MLACLNKEGKVKLIFQNPYGMQCIWCRATPEVGLEDKVSALTPCSLSGTALLISFELPWQL